MSRFHYRVELLTNFADIESGVISLTELYNSEEYPV